MKNYEKEPDLTKMFVWLLALISAIAIASVCALLVFASKYNKTKTELNALTEAEIIRQAEEEAKEAEKAEEKEPEYDLKVVPKEGEMLVVNYGAEYQCEYAYFIGDIVAFKLSEYDVVYYASTSQVVVLLRKIPEV